MQAQTIEFSALIADLVHLIRDSAVVARWPIDLRTVIQTVLNRVRRRTEEVTR